MLIEADVMWMSCVLLFRCRCPFITSRRECVSAFADERTTGVRVRKIRKPRFLIWTKLYYKLLIFHSTLPG